MTLETLLREAPVWNIGDNLSQFLTWADNVDRLPINGAGRVGEVLRNFAYIVCGKMTLRPSVRRFLEDGKAEQLAPWILRASFKGLNDTPRIVDMLNREFRTPDGRPNG